MAIRVKGRGGATGALALVAAVTCGCAAITKQAPDERRKPGDAPVCSTGRGAVALDILLGVAIGAGAAAALSEEEGEAALLLGVLGGVFVASAVSGHRAATRCEEAIDSYDLYRDAERAEAREQRKRERAEPRAAPAQAAIQPPTGARPAAAAPPPPAPEAEAPAPAPAAPPVPGSDAWREFWKEVPR